jgi:hypothetical protein
LHQLHLTSIRRGFTFSFFGKCTVTTPFFNSTEILTLSITTFLLKCKSIVRSDRGG